MRKKQRERDEGVSRVLFAVMIGDEGLSIRMDTSLSPEQLMMLESCLRHSAKEVGWIISEALNGDEPE